MQDTTTIKAGAANIPALGLGTYGLNGEACSKIVAQAAAIGYRHFDTAAMYGNEEAVGAGLRAAGLPRSEVFVTTKVMSEHIADGALQRSAEQSLARLKLDTVDLLLIHWPNPRIPLKASIKALCDARKRGLARHIGVSNFPSALLEEALGHASEEIVANQCEYHPRLAQTKLIETCRRHSIAFTSYCPLGRGDVLSEPVVLEIARAHHKTPAQIVLRWHVQQPGVAAIPKSGTPSRLSENINIFDFALSESDMARLFALQLQNGRMVQPAHSPRWDPA